MVPTKEELKRWLESPGAVADLRAQIAQSATTPHLLDAIRREIDDRDPIPSLTYTLPATPRSSIFTRTSPPLGENLIAFLSRFSKAWAM